jgi:hypothetical protein
MATVTPVYNWPVPTSTDYVKDGATSIEALGDAIDASLNSITGGGNVGLVHISSSTLSNVASVNINNVFTSAYKNYRILLDINAVSTSPTITMRLRAGGVDSTTSDYDKQDNGRTGGTNFGGLTNGVTNWSLSIGGRQYLKANLDLFNPQVSTQTFGIGTAFSGDLGANIGASVNVVDHRLSYQADGFSLAFAGGNVNGIVQVYGYRD